MQTDAAPDAAPDAVRQTDPSPSQRHAAGEAGTLALRVRRATLLNPLIRELELVAPDGTVLPGFAPGAHVQLQVPLPDGRSDWRHYSLVELTGDAAACRTPSRYVIAVRREADGRGGSRHLHEHVAEGDTLQVRPPRNDFALQPGGGRVVLMAGGIGVTPIASMAACARAQGRAVAMTYAGRSRALMAYLAPLQALLGQSLMVHADDERGGTLDVDAVLAGCGADEVLHVCGPQALLDQVLARAQARGWPRGRVRFELFSAPVAPAGGDAAFEAVLSRSGRSVRVPADKTLLDCLIDAGCDPVFDCRRGECGVCAVAVLEGEVDHRDHVLSAGEKQSNQVMQVCVSRARGNRLVLDL